MSEVETKTMDQPVTNRGSTGWFRKRPVKIQAWRWDNNGPPEFPAWLEGDHRLTVFDGRILIDTLEGVMAAVRGDWIVKGVRGELHPVKDHIFRQTYEAVATYTERAGLGEALISSVLLEALKGFDVYLVEGDSRVHLRVGDLSVPVAGQGSPAGVTLLRLNALQRAAIAQAEAVR